MSQPTAKVAIFNKPAYPVSEAAYILNLPLATVKAWSFGQMRRDDGKVRFKAVIRAADTNNRLLSFANLCELHVLAAIRRVHRVSLPKVRDSVEYVRHQLGADRPLIVFAIDDAKPPVRDFTSTTMPFVGVSEPDAACRA